MKLPIFSFVAAIIFACTLTSSVHANEKISRETMLHDYRTRFHIEPKNSSDGVFSTQLCAHTPTLGGKVWIPNHTRTLRALLAVDARNGEKIIYVEHAQPRMCYELHGVSVLQNADEMYWMSPTTIGFIVGASSTEPTEYLVDVQTLSYTYHPFVHGDHLYQRQSGALYVD